MTSRETPAQRRERERQEDRRQGRWFAAAFAAFLLLVTAGVVGYLLANKDEARPVADETPTVQVQGFEDLVDSMGALATAEQLSAAEENILAEMETLKAELAAYGMAVDGLVARLENLGLHLEEIWAILAAEQSLHVEGDCNIVVLSEDLRDVLANNRDIIGPLMVVNCVTGRDGLATAGRDAGVVTTTAPPTTQPTTTTTPTTQPTTTVASTTTTTVPPTTTTTVASTTTTTVPPTTTTTVANRPPNITSHLANQEMWVEGTARGCRTFTVQAFDPDGDQLTFSWNVGGSGPSVEVCRQEGEWTVTVTVSDGRGGFASSSATFTVLARPGR